MRRLLLVLACLLPMVLALIAVQHGGSRAPAAPAAAGTAARALAPAGRAVTVARVTHAATAGGHVYVANSVVKTISQYTVSPAGGLVPLSPATLSTGAYSPYEMGLTPDGHYLYLGLTTGGTGIDQIGQYTVSADGGLTPMTPPMVTTASGPVEIVTAPDGKHLYVNNSAAGVISQYSIGPSGGLTKLSPTAFVTPAGGASEITMSPGGKFLYSAGGSISQFSIDPATGALSPLTPATVGNPGIDMKITTDGKYLYSAGSGISQYSIAADGQLTPLSVTPVVAPGLGAMEMELTGNGKFLYATATDPAGQSQIEQFKIGTDGQLIALTPALVPTGNYAIEVVVSPDSGFLYVGNDSFSSPPVDDTISQFSIGPTGQLTPLAPPTVTTGAGAGALAATPPTAVLPPAVIPTTTDYTGALTGLVGHAAQLSARLTISGLGTPIPAMTMQLAFNGKEGCTATTNADGTAACTVTPAEKAATYPVTANFAGTAGYAPSAASAPFVLAALTPAFIPPTQATPTTAAPTPTTAPTTTPRPVAVPVVALQPILPVTGTSNHGELAGLAVLMLALLGIRTLRRAGR